MQSSRNKSSTLPPLFAPLVQIALLLGLVSAPDLPAQETANPAASPAAKGILRFYASLSAKPDGRLLSGQFLGYDNKVSATLLESIQSKAGVQVAMVGGDYAHYAETHRILYDRTNPALIAAWKAGALVALQIHMTDPAGVGLRSTTTDLNQLLTPGNPVHANWMAQMDQIAAGLKQLQENGVVVLFRPFHEMNGAWFWWGGKDPALFVKVWRQMFDYFTRTKGLNNLLWVYGPNHGVNPHRWYPGDAYVDITGLDAYTSKVGAEGIQGYPEMIKLGKPFGFSEFGPENAENPSGNFDYRTFLRGLKSEFPQAVFFMSWDEKWSLASNLFVKEMLTDPYVLNRAGLPPSWETVAAVADRYPPARRLSTAGADGAGGILLSTGTGSWVDMRGKAVDYRPRGFPSQTVPAHRDR